MAETAPTQTLITPENQPPAAGAGIDPTVTLEFESHLKPRDKTMTLVRRLEADAKLRGFEDIRGLDLKVYDGHPGDDVDPETPSQHFRVTDTSTQMVYDPVREPRGLIPHVRKPLITFKDGEGRLTAKPRYNPGAITYDTELTTVKKTGIPRPRKHGSEITLFERKEERIDPVPRKFVTFETYDEYGHVTGTRTERLSDFYALAGAELTGHAGGEAPHATWNWHGRQEASAETPKEEIEVGISRSKPVFEDVTKQLEDQGITNWVGLSWKLAEPGKNRVPGHDSSKKGIGVHAKTQEITSDDVIQEPNNKGTGHKHTRGFTIRTTEHYEDGTQAVLEDIHIKDYDLRHYFEKPGDFKESAYDLGEDPHAINPHKAGFKGVTGDTVLWDMRVAAPATERSRGYHQPPSLDEALRTLSYPERHNLETEEGRAAHEADVEIMKRSSRKQKYAEELQKAVHDVGRDYFINTIRDAHHDAISRLERLGILDTISDRERASASWVAEGLLKASLALRDDGETDPFGSLVENHFPRDFIDDFVGRAFSDASIKSQEVSVPDGKDDDGEPKTKKKVLYEFNEELFETGITPRYGGWEKTKEWRDKTWGPITKLSRAIYDYRMYEADPEKWDKDEIPEPIKEEDYKKLGRLLGRAFGQ